MSELAPFQNVLTLQGRLVDGSGYRDVGVAHFDYGKAERFREAHERAYNALLFWQRVDQLDSAGEPTLF